jgi:excisionase family DNA binding protein
MTARRRGAGRLVSAKELARYCDVDLKTIHNWTNRGKIEGIRTEGRHLRFRRMDVVDFLRSYEFPLPDALRAGSARVVVIDGGGGDLGALRKVLARRFEVETFDDVVEGLVRVGALDADVIVLGDVSPLDLRSTVASLRAAATTRSARVVTLGAQTQRAAGSAPRGDPSALCDVLERVTGTG